jgi:hypothetical protein
VKKSTQQCLIYDNIVWCVRSLSTLFLALKTPIVGVATYLRSCSKWTPWGCMHVSSLFWKARPSQVKRALRKILPGSSTVFNPTLLVGLGLQALCYSLLCSHTSNDLLPKLTEDCHSLLSNGFKFQRDGAQTQFSHRAQECLGQCCPDLIKKEWPSYSPDLNPLDYHLF